MASTDSAVLAAASQHQSSHSHHSTVPTGHYEHAADIMPSFSNNSAGRIGRYQIIKTLGEGSFGKVKCKYS